jgi:hypothetical protein
VFHPPTRCLEVVQDGGGVMAKLLDFPASEHFCVKLRKGSQGLGDWQYIQMSIFLIDDDRAEETSRSWELELPTWVDRPGGGEGDDGEHSPQCFSRRRCAREDRMGLRE